jgi:SAM-dependent methyltransferase
VTDHPPTDALAFTGERFLPELRGEIWHEHWHRYALARPIAHGLRVLDAACGEGYGSALVGQVAREVVGVDVAPDAVAHATRRYGSGTVRFVAASCSALPFADASFDLVVSFETIEHLEAQREMLDEFRRVLGPHGLLLLSSPNKPAYGALGPGRNEYHVRELTRDELAAVLAPRFPAQRWYGQTIVARSAVWSDDVPHERVEIVTLDGEGRVAIGREPSTPVYFLVLAAAQDADLPRLPPFSLFGDPEAGLLSHYRASIQKAAQLYWDERNATKIADERQAELVAAVNALAQERDASKALRQRIGALEPESAALRDDLARARGDLARASDDLAAARHDAAALGERVRWLESLRGWCLRPVEVWRAGRTGHGRS